MSTNAYDVIVIGAGHNGLVTATYLAIATQRKAGPGVFRAHDMLQLRATVQLN